MRIGVPREIKNNEARVGLTPECVFELVANGHDVFIEKDLGTVIGYSDILYTENGATILENAEDVFNKSDMIVKVKEPQPQECKLLKAHHILFTYLHLANDKKQTELLQESRCAAIAYETIVDRNGKLPVLAPMSEIAGRMSIQVGAQALHLPMGGRGVLLGGVPGVLPANVVVLGGGVAGLNAARMAKGLGADVVVLDLQHERLAEIDNMFGSAIKTVISTKANIYKHLCEADLVIGAVLVPGATAPKLVTREMFSDMKPGAVLVDIAIDQGGCFETSRATTHQDPTYIIDGIVHYCVANMPGAVARTSSLALNAVTLPLVNKIAGRGLDALKSDECFLQGLNVYDGKVTCKAVADSLGYDYIDPHTLI